MSSSLELQIAKKQAELAALEAKRGWSFEDYEQPEYLDGVMAQYVVRFDDATVAYFFEKHHAEAFLNLMKEGV